MTELTIIAVAVPLVLIAIWHLRRLIDHLRAVKPVDQYCLGFLFDSPSDAASVVLLKKAKPAWQAGLLNGVGGKIEPGEIPTQAMIREFNEEAGVMVYSWTKFAVFDYFGAVVHCYTATNSRGFAEAQTINPDEPLVKIPLADIHTQPTIDNIPWLIAMALAKRKDPKSPILNVIYE